MSNSVQKHRNSAFKKQYGRCYYCGALMWIKNPKKFATDHSISYNDAAELQCTAEHVVARCDDGKNTKDNIVAACKRCNSTRHKMKPAPASDPYKKRVQKSIKKGKWHKASVINSMF